MRKRKSIASLMVFFILLLSFGSFANPVKAAEQPTLVEVVFMDTDTDPGEIGGDVTFTVSGENDTEYYDKYDISYVYGDYESTKMVEVKATGRNSYTAHIPDNTKIPVGATDLEVTYVYKPGLSVSWVGRYSGLADNTSGHNVNSVDIDVPEAISVSYSEGGMGDNSDESLVPSIYVRTKDKINDYSYQDGDKEYTPEDVRYAAIYYLDAEGNKLKSIGDIFLKDGENGFNFPDLTKVLPPIGTAAIGVFAKNSLGESKDYIGIGLLDEINSQINDAELYDTNPLTNKIAGKLFWQKPKSEKNIRSYGIYATWKGGYQKGKKLAEVPATGQKYYSADIPEIGMSLLNGEYLTVVPEFHGFFESYLGYVRVQEITSETDQPRTLRQEDVVVDSIGDNTYNLTAYQLQPHDTIFIYDQPTGGNLIYTVEAYNGYYSNFDLMVAPGMNEVYASVKSGYGIEGERTLITLGQPKVTSVLTSKQISVDNNQVSMADVIKVTGIVKGDTIRVYDGISKRLITSGVAGSSTLTLNLEQLGAISGSIYISRQQAGMLESQLLKISYQAEQSSVLKSSQLKVTNNQSKDDLIEVSNVSKGDIIYVYNSANNRVAYIKSNTSKAVLSIKQLGSKSGYVWVSIMKEGLNESTKLKVAFGAEPSLSLKTSQVKVANNQKISDVIQVTGISKSDTIYVYNSANNRLASLKATSSKANLFIKQLGSRSGYVWVSIVKEGLKESSKLKIAFGAEPSLALRTSQIKVTNNKKKSDIIQISGISKGDTILVYNSSNKRLISKNATTSKVTLSYKQLGKKSGSVWISVIKSGLKESPKLKVAFKAEK
ncbi:hypothetical protein [Neobacillus drentensis]|uniref:hypothetical protein n=1 Tax=Neobacillus drentensis TaxID=220684 RepID=UPI002FFF603C